jgi:hypothetical protein
MNAHMGVSAKHAGARTHTHTLTHTCNHTHTITKILNHIHTQKYDADGGGSIDMDEFRHLVRLTLGKYCDADCVSCTKCDRNNQVQQTILI